MSTVLLSAEESHSLPGLFLGAKQQVVLIYRDFITRKECFQNACLLLTTPPPQGKHACSSCSVVLMKDYLLMFSIKSRVSPKKEKTLKVHKEVGEKKVYNRVTKGEMKT